MCTLNNHQDKSKSVNSNNLMFDNQLLMIAIVVKYFDFKLKFPKQLELVNYLKLVSF